MIKQYALDNSNTDYKNSAKYGAFIKTFCVNKC